jgi:hypothetical protein
MIANLYLFSERFYYSTVTQSRLLLLTPLERLQREGKLESSPFFQEMEDPNTSTGVNLKKQKLKILHRGTRLSGIKESDRHLRSSLLENIKPKH